MAKDKNCKICSTPTPNVFNIELKAVPVCESCANNIMMQQYKWLSVKSEEWMKKELAIQIRKMSQKIKL